MIPVLEDLLPQAACLAERIEATWLEPAEDGPRELIAQDRWERWAERVANGHLRAFEGLLADRGIDADRARAALGPMKLRAGTPSPPWARVLDSLLCSAATPPAAEDLALARSITAGGSFPLADGQSLPLREGFAARPLAGFLPWARQALKPDRVASRELEDALLCHLLRDMALFSLPCLRGNADKAFPSERPPVEGWTAILHESPALARVLGVIARDWQLFASELLERLDTNGPDLVRLLDGVKRSHPAVPVGCGPFAGDRHDQGRCVVPVDFSDGGRVYYKPRDLRLGDALAALIDLLDVDLLLPRRLRRPGYVFEEAVEESRPSSSGGWGRLAREVGMWISLFEMLGASDLLRTNVVIAAEHLVPIDTESLVPFLFVPADDVPWAPAGSHSSLLTAPLLTRAEESVENVGLLADRTNAGLLDHLDAMLEGYTFMQRRLVERRDAVLCELQSWAPLPARAVVRNTWVYFRLLMDSLRPTAMGDGVERDLVLERLWRAHLDFELPGKLVEAEVAALRELDVPLFRFFGGGRDMIGPGGHVAEGALHDPPLTLVTERLESLPSEPEQADLDGLRTLAFCAAPGHRADHENLVREPASTPRFADLDWGEQAARVGEQLLDHLRHAGPGGQRLSVALAYVAHNDAFVLCALGAPDVQWVTGGVVLVLAQLADLVRWRGPRNGTQGETVSLADELGAELAALREHVVEAVQRSLDDVERWLERGVDPPLCGLHGGLPASMYTLCALGREIAGTDTQDVLARAIGLLATFDPAQAWPRGKLLPAAGLLLALEVLAERRERLRAPEDRILAEIRGRLVVYLLEHWERASPTSRISPVLEEVLPSPRAAASLALWRHSSNVGIALPDPVAAWIRDSRPDAGGDRFALLAVGGHPQRPEIRDTSLGCMNLLEHCVVEYRGSGDPAALRTAAECGERLIARKEQFGCWFPEGLAADRYRISALWGVAAVARGFCALAAPDDAWSLRLLELPRSATNRR